MKIMGIKQWIFHEVALLVHYFQVELDFGMLVFVKGGKPEDPGKNPRSKDENQQQTQITCETRSRNGTQATADGRQAFLPLRQPRPQEKT